MKRVTSQTEAIRKVLQALEQAGIPYMIVGSVAASFHGFSRATHDLDVVASLTPESVHKLADALGEEFYFDEQAALKAAAQHDVANAIHMESGIKVDFWVLHEDEYSRVQFSRRVCVDFEGIPACIASAEDTILSKLLWYRETRSDRQLSDVQAVLETNKDNLDWQYLGEWANRLGVDDLLKDMRHSDFS